MAIAGTFKLHVIVPSNAFTVLTRETSYYCNGCLENPTNNIHEWKEHLLCKIPDYLIGHEQLAQEQRIEPVQEVTVND